MKLMFNLVMFLRFPIMSVNNLKEFEIHEKFTPSFTFTCSFNFKVLELINFFLNQKFLSKEKNYLLEYNLLYFPGVKFAFL